MPILSVVDRVWGRLLWLLMAIAAVYIGVIMMSIVYTTIFRSAGWSYTNHAFTLIEYGFPYILFLGAPWLVGTRSHIYIELLTAALPERPRVILSRIIVLACAAICFVWVWYTWALLIERVNDPMAFDELRAQFDIPRWLGTLPFPFGFLLMGIEFLRLVFTKEPMHTGIAGVASDRAELEEHKRSYAKDS